MLSRIGFILGFFALVGCATPITFGTSASPTPHMVHNAPHGGELGMGQELHIEILSERAAQYKVYLYDPSGKPIPTEGNQVEVAIIDTSGKKLSSFPASAVGSEYFVAAGVETNSAKTDVRVTVMLKGKSQPVEMDFTIEYKGATWATATPFVRATLTAPVALPAVTVAPGRLPAVHWLVTQNDITVKMFFDPYPPRLGTTNTFSILLTDSTGQPLSDAAVALTVTGGMAGMMGEHDEDFRLELTHRGAGIYSIQGSPGSSMLEFGGLSLRITRGGRVFAYAISKDELPLR